MSTNEERLIELGDAAEQLLASEPFNIIVNGLVDSAFQKFANSPPGDKEGREQTYCHYRALVEVVNSLKQSVSIRDEAIVKRDTSEEEA